MSVAVALLIPYTYKVYMVPSYSSERSRFMSVEKADFLLRFLKSQISGAGELLHTDHSALNLSIHT